MNLQSIRQREFRPGYILFAPVFIWWFLSCLKARSMTYIFTANPGIPLEGYFEWSKREIYKQLDSSVVPDMWLIKNDGELKKFLSENSNISYPLVAKPDLGKKGYGVKVVYNEKELIKHLANSYEKPWIVQTFIDLPLEYGVMYHRTPGEEKGVVTGIVEKKFLHVTGNGIDTLQTLIKKHPRAYRFEKIFAEIQQERMQETICEGEEIQLSHIGSHTLGSVFYDRSELINAKVVKLFDSLAAQVDGFYYGRFDIKIGSPKDLETGENLQIIEINGSTSEPIFIYDPEYQLTKAYKVLFEHGKILYTIAKKAHAQGTQHLSFSYALKKIIGGII